MSARIKTDIDAFKNNLNTITAQAEKTYTGGLSVLKGLPEGFGVTSKNYIYSYRIINDTPKPVRVEQKKAVLVMGARFPGKVSNELIIPPFSSSDSDFLISNSIFLYTC